jgi:hypothetical protein
MRAYTVLRQSRCQNMKILTLTFNMKYKLLSLMN